MDRGELDIVLAKQKPGRSRGRHLFTERLLWAGDASILAGDDGAVPLALFPEPSATRTAILDTLRDARRSWTVLTESISLSGIVAAVASGFAISAFSKHFMPSGVSDLPTDAGLPSLPSLDYVIDQRAMPRDPAIDAFVDILSATIERSGTTEDESPRSQSS